MGDSEVGPAVMVSHMFCLVENPKVGPIRLGPGWYDKSQISCARKCISDYPDCKSFMYNSVSGLCTPSSGYTEIQPAPSGAEGSLYHSFNCPPVVGFSLQTYGSTTAYVGIFGPPLNYTKADAACRSKGAFLASVKTLDKLMIFHRVWTNETTWVGCDDLAEAGVYRWKEDSEILTNSTIKEVFDPKEPNKQFQIPACVNIGSATGKLGDFFCSVNYKYPCEINIK